MLLYLKHALAARLESAGSGAMAVEASGIPAALPQLPDDARAPQSRPVPVPLLLDAIREGAVLRVRPKAMTVAVILAGLVPIVWGGGTGSEIMSRIAAPMLGGMITAPLLSLLVIPAAYRLMRSGDTGRL